MHSKGLICKVFFELMYYGCIKMTAMQRHWYVSKPHPSDTFDGFSQLCLNNWVRKNIREALNKSEMAAGALTNQIASKQSDKNCSSQVYPF